MHILVVEDDTGLARQIASVLTEAGHDPIVVHDGEKAMDKTSKGATAPTTPAPTPIQLPKQGK